MLTLVLITLGGGIVGALLGVAVPYALSLLDGDPSSGGAYAALALIGIPVGALIGATAAFLYGWGRG